MTLTGERTFRGDTMTDVMAAIVTREPAWPLLPIGRGGIEDVGPWCGRERSGSAQVMIRRKRGPEC